MLEIKQYKGMEALKEKWRARGKNASADIAGVALRSLSQVFLMFSHSRAAILLLSEILNACKKLSEVELSSRY